MSKYTRFLKHILKSGTTFRRSRDLQLQNKKAKKNLTWLINNLLTCLQRHIHCNILLLDMFTFKFIMSLHRCDFMDNYVMCIKPFIKHYITLLTYSMRIDHDDKVEHLLSDITLRLYLCRIFSFFWRLKARVFCQCVVTKEAPPLERKLQTRLKAVLYIYSSSRPSDQLMVLSLMKHKENCMAQYVFYFKLESRLLQENSSYSLQYFV